MSHRYELRYSNTARKGIKHLDGPVRKRVRAALEALADDPRPRGCTRVKGQADMWRIRVGEYRIRYEVDDNVLIVLVLKVASRDRFYDDL